MATDGFARIRAIFLGSPSELVTVIVPAARFRRPIGAIGKMTTPFAGVMEAKPAAASPVMMSSTSSSHCTVTGGRLTGAAALRRGDTMAKLRGRQAFKRLGLEVSGWILVVAGIAALILPGPGLLGLFAG